VFVAEAGDSAGQAAIHLSRQAARVTILARGHTLAASSSDYLVGGIGATLNIDVRARTGIAGAGGLGMLEWSRPETRDGGGTRDVLADALLVLIGTEPRTGWPDETVERDASGYIPAGDEPARGVRRKRCPARRGEAGGLCGGEGTIAITSIHQHLRERASPGLAGAGRG
jgi:thioredoxin reductase (NADPH)